MHKIFVLDTSVILYDPCVIHSFEEHDIAIPLTVLEELDEFKKGNGVLNRNAREFIRQLDAMSGSNLLREWIPLNGEGSGRVRVLPTLGDHLGHERSQPQNDQLILRSALELAAAQPDRRVILVSKDINLRLKARAMELLAEDYKTIQISDVDRLASKTRLQVEEPQLIDRIHREGDLVAEGILADRPDGHHFYILQSADRSALARYMPATGRLQRIVKGSAYGIQTRNAEQTFALEAILDPEIHLVTLTGPAGTGKTLLALAGALEQRRQFRRVLMARPIVPLSNKDLGYLPGDVRSKIDPYMQPLWDNLGFIKGQFEPTDAAYRQIEEMVESRKLEFIPLAYIRGRTLARTLFMIDEAQNLTPHEVKTIITRAGEGTKIILTGDIFQIDTPYLDVRSNGLSFLIDRLRGHPLHAHVNLEKGERSELANLASELL